MARESEEFILSLGDAIARYCGEEFVLVNVGAEDGYEASRLLDRFPGSRAYCIEAVPMVPPKRVTGSYRGIIGEYTGPTPFYINKEDGALNSNKDRGGPTFCIEAYQYRLDDFLAAKGIESPTALLIDTEGTTGDVLTGAGELLNSVQFVCAEVQARHPWGGTPASEVDRLLAPSGLSRVPGGYASGDQANLFWARV